MTWQLLLAVYFGIGIIVASYETAVIARFDAQHEHQRVGTQWLLIAWFIYSVFLWWATLPLTWAIFGRNNE